MKNYYTDLRNRNKKIYNLIKEINKCAKCGDSRHYVLDFHHAIRSDKSFDVSLSGSNTYSIKNIISEIKKCICLCSNCHREFHYLENNKDLTLLEYIGADSEIQIPDNLLIEFLKTSNTKQSRINKKTGLIGVSYSNDKGKYVAIINRTNSRIYRYFANKEDAARLYDEEIEKLDGIDAWTNKKLGLI